MADESGPSTLRCAITASATISANGASGNGALVFRPCVSSSESMGLTTGSGWAGNKLDFGSADTLWSTTLNGNSPFNDSAFPDPTDTTDGNSGIRGRVVAMGLRYRYKGNDRYNDGMIYGYVSSDHRSLSDNTYTEIQNRIGSTAVSVKEATEWQYLTCFADSANEERFTTVNDGSSYTLTSGNPYTFPWILSTGPYTKNSNSHINASFCGVIWIRGGNETEHAELEVELIQHVEFIGYNASSMYTAGHGDPEGRSKALLVARKTHQRGTRVSPDHKSIIGGVKNAIKKVAKDLKPIAMDAGLAAIGAALL